MTTDEILAVLQAFKEGKKIEAKCKPNGLWKETSIPLWNFADFDYRVKPEPHYRPFESAEEVMEAIKEHGDWVKQKANAAFVAIHAFDNEYLSVGDAPGGRTYQSLFYGATFVDGTPFGKLVEE